MAMVVGGGGLAWGSVVQISIRDLYGIRFSN